jgi:tetratricopeptide (TPR) repeat protein
MTPGPDWEPVPDYGASLAVAVRREPRTIAYAVARARQLVEAGEPVEARRQMATWPRSWRTSAPGQIVQAEVFLNQERWKQALGAFNRARVRDRSIARIELGRGVALSEMARERPSAVAFARAARLDPTDPAAAGFRAYALLKQDRTQEAIAEARRAVGLDPRYADAFLPLGIGLLTSGDRRNGVRMLRRGLILLEESARARRLIAQHLDPTDP